MSAVHAKYVVDSVSVMSLLATFAGWLPNVAALLTVIWTAIRIVETRTFQRWLGRFERKEK